MEAMMGVGEITVFLLMTVVMIGLVMAALSAFDG
jgi:hypothetical protein